MTFTDALLLVAIAAASPGPPANTTISGVAAVIDGDTISIDGHRIRLFGIDAPESEQRCTDEAGYSFNCGAMAIGALEEEIGLHRVSCEVIDLDQYRRSVGICMVDGIDLSDRMVRRGWAIDYPFFSGGHYAEAMEEARRAKRGLWAGRFIEPRAWRRGVR